MLRTVQAVNKSHSQEFEDIPEESPPVGRQEYVLEPSEGSHWMSSWRGLLNTRPKLYARLIDTLDSAISWGGLLPETDKPFLFLRRHEPPRSSLHQQFRAGKAALPLSPLLSPASTKRNTMEQTSPYLTCEDEPVSHVKSCQASAALLPPADLNGKFDNNLLQQIYSPDSHLNESIGETPSQTSLNTSSGILREEIIDSGRTVLDQIYVCDGAKGVTNDFTDTPEFMLGDDQNDDWMGAVLAEDMSLSGDDMDKGPDYARTDVCMTV
jgi:hypothetical protein